MPSPSSQCYSVSFHPTLDEWEECKTVFLDNFKKHYRKFSTILVKEKGNKNFFNHYQGFIDFNVDKRKDTVLKSAFNGLLKGIDISYPKVALKLTPITRDVQCCKGYTLKETDDEMSSIAFTDYALSSLIDDKRYYLSQLKTKRVGKDKQRLNLRNLPEIFKNFYEVNKEKYSSCLDTGEWGMDDVYLVLTDMGLEDYYVLPLLLRKDLPKIIKYLMCYISAQPDKEIKRLNLLNTIKNFSKY